MAFTMYNTGQEISLDKLADTSGIAKNTIKKYLEYLEAAFLLRSVHRLGQGASRFVRATTFKTYLTNPSIRAALFSQIDSAHKQLGPIIETGIFSQFFHTNPKLFYGRWKTGEIDLIQLGTREEILNIIEIKYSDRIITHPEELKGLIQFCAKKNIPKATVTTKTQWGQITSQNTTIEFIPASILCCQLGYEMMVL
jgi:uncharacterized protein